jgi:outer membrane lipase/esterase
MFKRCLAVSALSLAGFNAAAQSNFTELVVFGDSLLDSGNFGIRFTNQLTDGSGAFAQVAPQYLATSLGLALEPAVLGGTNYAVGGYQTGQILNSIAGTGITTNLGSRPAYLVENAGSVGAGTLVLLDGGGNDLRDILVNNPPADAPALIRAAAETFVTSIGALHQAGAEYIMVANVPDLGNTPGVRLAEVVSPGAVAGFSGATAGYNGGVQTLATLGLGDANIIPVDIAGFVSFVQDNAESYGLANGEIDVSAGFGFPAGSVLMDQRYMCYQATVTAGVPDCVEHPVFGINGASPDPRKLFFNDSLHPTEVTSEIFGDYLADLIAAPMTVGLLPELALSASRAQSAVAADQLRNSRWGEAKGGLFVAGDMSTAEFDSPAAPEAETQSLTVGRTFVASESLVYGLALTVGSQELDISGADFEADSWGLTGLLGYRKDALFVDATAGLSVLSYDGLKRDVKLGSQTFTAKADTDGHAWAVDVLAGYNVLSSDNLQLAPAIGFQYSSAVVESYAETGAEISNYQWGEQKRDSLQLRYGVVASMAVSQTVKLYAELFGNQEQEDGDESLQIRNPNFNTLSYRLPSFNAGDDSFVTATVGGSVAIGDAASVNLTYNYSNRDEGAEQLMVSVSIPM